MCFSVMIESSALITVVVAAISTMLSAVVTWYFSKRRYAVPTQSVTPTDLEMEKLRITARSDLLGFWFMLVVFLALLFPLILVMVISALRTPN